MYNRLFRYSEFLLENTVDLILEAKIAYSKEFSEILMKIDSKVSDALKEIVGKEVDVNTNYIDIDPIKGDMLKFKPNDKVGKSAIATQSGAHFDVFSKKVLGEKYRNPVNGQTGIIEREISKEEAGEGGYFAQFVYPHSTLVVFMWRDANGEGRCVFDKRNLDFGPNAVKSSEIGVGRFVKGLLKKADINFSDVDIEDFVYKYRAEINKKKDVISRFRIVSGNDIKKLYHQDSYEVIKGTLGKSCMRYPRCQNYFGIYVENPDVCSMVVLDSEISDGKICGRALLWTDNTGRKIMDRIYTNRTEDEVHFKEFAKKNGFWHKETQGLSDSTWAISSFVSPTGEIEELSVVINIKGSFSNYPYVDTFKYYRDKGDSSYLTNDNKKLYDYELKDTEGGNGEECEFCRGNGNLECPECYGRGTQRCQECDSGYVDCLNCDGNGNLECPDCDGLGEDPDGVKCENCGGAGKQTCPDCDGDGKSGCSECGGEGRIGCDFCNGDGNVDCPECG